MANLSAFGRSEAIVCESKNPNGVAPNSRYHRLCNFYGKICFLKALIRRMTLFMRILTHAKRVYTTQIITTQAGLITA